VKWKGSPSWILDFQWSYKYKQSLKILHKFTSTKKYQQRWSCTLQYQGQWMLEYNYLIR
jgi:hypothetical protein